MEFGAKEAIEMLNQWLNKELDNPPFPVPENIVKSYVLVEEPDYNPIGLALIFANDVERSMTLAGREGEYMQMVLQNLFKYSKNVKNRRLQ